MNDNLITRKQISTGIVSQHCTHDGTTNVVTGGDIIFNVVPGQVYTLQFSGVSGWASTVLDLYYRDTIIPGMDDIAFLDTDDTTPLSVNGNRSFALIMPADQLVVNLTTPGDPVFVRATPIGY